MTAKDISSSKIKKIDEEIAEIYTRLSSLRTERNSLVLIACLPFEILARVFWFTLPTVIKTSSFRAPDDYFVLHNLARVSRYWRDTVLHSPSLWTRPTLTRTERVVRQMVLRAGSKPLTLFVDDQRGVFILHEDTLTACIKRAEYVAAVSTRNGDKLVSLLRGNDTPLLKHLELYDFGHLESTDFSIDRFSMLQTLCLTASSSTPWIGHIFPRLTCLSLVGGASSARYPASEVWDLIASSANLEVLNLQSAVERGSSEARRPAINLPYLKDLHIRDHPEIVVTFLELNFPPSAMLFIGLEPEATGDISGAYITELLAIVQLRSGYSQCSARMSLSFKRIRLDWHAPSVTPLKSRRLASLALYPPTNWLPFETDLERSFVRALDQIAIDSLTIDGAKIQREIQYKLRIRLTSRVHMIGLGHLLHAIADKGVRELDASGVAIKYVCTALYHLRTRNNGRLFATITLHDGHGTDVEDLLTLLNWQYPWDRTVNKLCLYNLDELSEDLEDALGDIRVPQLVVRDCMRYVRP